ncbi:MAG: InlB B-repeat-containing protein [Clostridia bacterium]|nr:InlB B-repeat-containing protein [Clostridia bacterium]
MKKSYKVLALMLLVSTLISLFAVNALAVAQGYPMECTVYYKDESGNTLANAKTFSVNASDESAWNTGVASPSISGYALKKDGDSFVSYSIMDKYFPASNYVRHGTATYTVVYVRTYTHTVYYMYGVNTRPAAETVSITGKPGTAYSFTSPTVSGHGPSQSTVTGTILSTNTSTTVYYYPYTYTVSYNAMGGSGAPSSQTKTYGVPLTLSSAVPTKSGYTFEGWATSRGSSVVAFGAGGTYTGNSDLNLYAVWTQNNTNTPSTPTTPSEPSTPSTPSDPDATTYTVTYHANGGTGAPSSQTKYAGEKIIISSVEPTRSGYTFSGWAITSTSTYPSYTAGGTYSKDADLDLYAIWLDGSSSGSTPSEPRTCTVTYNANGGTGAPAAQSVTSGSKLTLSSTIPRKSGYNFKGWGTQSWATSAAYSAGGTYTITSDMVLYAVWERGGTYFYTVTFDANGGSGAPDPITADYGETITIPDVEPYRSGYNFINWENQNTSEYYYPGASMTVMGTTTLTAVWYEARWDDDPFGDEPTVPTTYTVSYNANGGSGAPSSQTKTEGVALTLSSTKPTRSGYTFLGWSESSSATSATYSAGGTYSKDASTTLYAVWKKNTTTTTTYTVSYNANGGTGAPSNQTKTKNVALILSSVIPTRTGYTFLGWATSSSATSATYQPGGSYTANANATLYAVWQKITYNFYVSNLAATPNELYQNESTHISFTLGLTSSESKSGIPVEVFFDGTTVYSANLDFSANGTTTIAFDLNVGGFVGDKLLTVRINWSDRTNESNSADNTSSVTVSVRKYIETSSTAISLSGKYVAGTEVISSFFAENGADSDILPSDNMSFGFEVYEISGTTETLITAQKKDNVVVPANGSNLVYFKWTIPEDAAGKTYMVKGTMNVDGKANEVNPNNNSSFITILVNDKENSQTPDTRYEEIAPSSYLPSASSPEISTGLMTWNEWEYDASTSSLVLRQYGVSVSSAPAVAPDSECKSATKSGDVWTMKSGYGITISWNPTLDTPSGYSAAKADSVTGAQIASAYFPEFNYSGADGYYRTLENVSGTFEFIENVDAVNGASVHFIPIYVQNGDYVVSCTASQIWTPAGMITVTQNANTVKIDGTIYDDWYQG